MEKILKKMMNAKCVSMHDSHYRCYGKGCDGSCASFQVTLMEVKEKITEAQKEFIESMTLYNSEQEFNHCENN